MIITAMQLIYGIVQHRPGGHLGPSRYTFKYYIYFHPETHQVIIQSHWGFPRTKDPAGPPGPSLNVEQPPYPFHFHGPPNKNCEFIKEYFIKFSIYVPLNSSDVYVKKFFWGGGVAQSCKQTNK